MLISNNSSRKILRLILLLGIVMFTRPFLNAQTVANDIRGTWLVDEKDAHIKIYLAKNGKYYGKIVWLNEPNEKDGTPKIDDENPNPKLQSRPLLGLLMLKGFSFNEQAKEWSGGTIYDSRAGKTYDAYMKFVDENKTTLKLTGYIMGIRQFGKTTTWTRAN